MGLTLKYRYAVGLATLIGAILSTPTPSYAQLTNKEQFPEPMLALNSTQTSHEHSTKDELPPIFTQTYVEQLRHTVHPEKPLFHMEDHRNLPITLEQSVTTFQTRGEAGRYASERIAQKLGGVLAIYTRSEVGSAKFGNGKDLSASVGLRNIEPRFEVALKELAGTKYKIEAELRPSTIAEFKIIKDLKGGQKGIYTGVDKNKSGDIGVKVLIGYQKRY